MISVSVPAFDFGVEMTYPLNESYSTTWLNISANLFTVIVTYIDSVMIERSDFKNTGDTSGSFNCYLVEPIISGAALLFALFMRENLKRLNAEKEKDK